MSRRIRLILRIAAFFSVIILTTLSFKSFAQNCTVNAGIPLSLCANESLNLDGSQSGLIGTLGEWSQVSGPSVIINDPSDLKTSISGLEFVGGNDITFRLSATCSDGSLVSQDVTFTIDQITSADAGDDLSESCPGTSIFTLDANAAGVGETGIWTSSGAGITIDNPASPTSTITISGTDGGVATLTWTITNPNGCSSSDDLTVTNLGGETPVDAGPDQALDNCYSSTQSTTMNATYGGDGINGQIGTWEVVDGPNFPVVSNVNNNETQVTNLIEGTYIFRWMVEGPCVQGSDEMTITVAAPELGITEANAGNFTVYCDGRESTVLTGNTPNFPGETVLWEFVSGPSTPTIDDPTSPITQVSGLSVSSTNTYTFRYTIDNATTGCSSQDLVRFEYITLPTLTVNGGNNIIEATCGEDEVSIPFTTSGGGNFDIRYSVVAGPSIFGETTDNISPIDISGLENPGIYTLRVRAVSVSSFGRSCPAVTEDITVIISDHPTAANPGTPQILACGVTNTSLQGNTPLIGVGTWYQLGGPNTANMVDSSNPETGITGLISGTYEFKWIIDGGDNCTANEGTVTVTVSADPPTIPLAGSDASICAGTSYVLQGNSPAATETGQWTVSPATGISFSDDTDPNAVVAGFSSNTAYTFTWTITGCTSSLNDDVVITTDNTGGPIPSVAGPDQTCIAGTSTTLAGNDPGGDNGTWSVISGSGTFANATSFNTSVSGLSTGENVFRWTISNGSGCADTFDEVNISVTGAVTTASITHSGDQCVTVGGTVNLVGSTPGAGEVASWTQTEGPVIVISDNNNSTATATFVESGNHTFQYEISNGCVTSSTATVSFTIGIDPTVADAGPDQSICYPTTSLNLAGNTISNGTGAWTMVSGPNLPNVADIFDQTTSVTDLTKGIYLFRWTASPDNGVCTSNSDDVQITVDVDADAGEDQALCNAESTLLVGNENTSGTWTEVTSNGATVTAVPGSPHLAIASDLTINTDYTFRYSLPNTGLCGATIDDVIVEVDGFGTTPNAGIDQEHCAATSFLMAAGPVTEGIGTWSLATSQIGVTFDDVHSPTTTVNGVSTPGLYVFNWTVVNGSCTYEDVVRIKNYAHEVANAGADQLNVCSYEVVINANATMYGSGSWTEDVSNPEANALSSLVDPNPSFLATTVGSYTFTWNIDNGEFCTDSSDDLVISLSSTSPTSATASDDQDFCIGDSDPTITGSTPVYGTGLWSVESEPGIASAGFGNASNASTTVTGLDEPGDYVLKWTITSGSCTSEVETTITVYEVPSTADAGADGTFCQFEDKSLAATTPATGTGLWSQISGPTTANIVNPSSPTTNLANVTTGTYVFEWTVSNGSCAQSTDQASVNIVDQVSQANAGLNQNMVITSTTLAANPAETGETGTWSVTGQPASTSLGVSDFSDVNSPASTFSGMLPGDYTLRWTVDDNVSPGQCATFDEMMITSIPIVSVAVSPASQGEDGAGAVAYNFTTNGPVTSDLVIYFNVDGDATFTSDYLQTGATSFGASSGTITISSGNTSAQIMVYPESDDNIELAETVELEITSNDAYSIGTATATGTITDDDTGIEAELTFNRDGAEGGNSVRFTLTLTDGNGTTLTNQTGSNFSVTFSITGDVDDFAAASFPTSINISDGNSSQNINLNVFDDRLIEEDETTTATLTNITHSSLSASISATINTASANIIDNDDDDVRFAIKTKQNGVEGESDLEYAVMLVNASGDTLTNATGSDFSASVGYAGATSQATSGSSTITLPDGVQESIINLSPGADTQIEFDDITASLSAPAHASITPSISASFTSATADIDDDAKIQIVTTQDGVEGGANVHYTVSLVRASNSAIGLTNATGSDITANVAFSGSAGSGDITTSFPSSITIANSSGSTIIDLVVDDDVLIEGDETLTATLSSPTMRVALSSTNASDDATITDNDDDTIVIELTATDGDEDGTDVTFIAQLTNGSGTNLINDTGSDITSDIIFSTSSAVAADFTTSLTAIETAGVVIADGNGSQTFTLVVNDDRFIEGPQTLEATLSSPVGATLAGGTDSDIANVGDNDDPILIIEVVQNGVENGADIRYRIKLEDISSNALTNDLGQAITGSINFSGALIEEFSEASFPTSFSIADGASEEIISFDPTNDTSFERESLQATISGPNTINAVTPTIGMGSATATIDDDAILVVVTAQDGEEVGTVDIEYTVTLRNSANDANLTNDSGSPVTATIDFSGEVVAADVNGGISNQIVSIAGTGASTAIIRLTPVDDALFEKDETVTGTISAPSTGVTIPPVTATDDAIITDDETATAALSVTTQGHETGSVAVVYTVTLSEVNHTGSAITFDFDDLGTGTATSGSDYTAISASAQVSVADGTNVGTISIPVTDDALLEADTETLIVQISNPSNGDVTITTATATGTITDDDTATADLSVTTQGNEDGSVAVVYTVTLSGINHTGSAITFDFEDLGTGTATSGSDYTAISGSAQVSVADGTNVGTISIPVTDDALLEADTETLIAQISTPSNGDVTITTATATGTITDDETATAALSVTMQGNETGSVAVVYTVTLSEVNHTGSAITFDFDDLGTGTATSGSDYTAISASAQVNVADGTNVGTISIPVTDDTLLEADMETLIVQISNPSKSSVTITTATATGTITDNDTATAALSVTTQGNENGPVALVYAVTLSGVNHTGSAITFDFEDLGTGTAISGSDYTAISGSEQISVTDGTNVGTISIPVTDDTLLEADTETLTAQISNPSNGDVSITTGTATGTITDDDTVTVALSVTTQGNETGSVAIVYTVTLSGVNHTGSAITFDFDDLSTGTATSGSDYTVISGSAQVSVADGTNVGTISIPVTDDALLEADTETLIAQISSPSNGDVSITTATATGTIIDDETATAALSVTTQGHETGSVAVVYTVTLSEVNHTGGAITFDFEDLGTGTATSGSDYTAISGSEQISVADGTNVGTISIPVTDDTLLEADMETLIVQISNPSKSSVTITTATATGTITDDDTATAALSVTTQGHETGTVAVVYTVTLSGINHTGSAITFDFDDLGTGTATSGSDYTAISGSAQVSVADGTNVGAISIPVTDDALLEADTETLIAQISNPSNGDVSITTATATGTIIDDETAIAALSVTTQGHETGSVAVVYTVTLSEVNHTGSAITFDFEDLGTGTATSGSDYTAISASEQISVTDGTNVGTISIPVTDDALLEADTETLITQISNPSKSSVTITTATATGTITDDETATAALSVTTQGHETGSVAVVYTVTLSEVNHTGGAITFDFEDLGTGTATSGSDYTAISASEQISVTDGTNVGTISIPVTDDALLEADTETLITQISNPSKSSVTITTATATGTITDDETATAALSVTTQGHETGSVAVVYTVTLSEVNHTGGAITFDFEDLGTGTATSGSDYTAISGSAQVSVADGTNVGTINIPVTDDALLEADTETLIVQISNPSKSSVTITTATATGTITDDDTATAALSVTTQGNEDGSVAVVYTVTLSGVNHTGGAITFDFEDLSTGTAISGSDYTVISASAQVSMADGTNVGTISIPVTDDALLEADTETLIAQISSPSNGDVTITTATATGTIIDDETATAALSVTTQGNETGSVAVVYTVTLSEVNHTGGAITFDFEDLGTGTATSGSDYTAISASAQVNVADGTNVGTISIPVTDDALLEADTETLIAQISNPSKSSVTITTATATGTITDNDMATAALSVTTQGHEAGSVAVVYTMTLSGVNHTGSAITFDFEDLGTGTATSGSDYTAISASAQVSVADGTNVGTISIPVTDDALLEADTETLTAQISSPSNGDVSITTATATGTITDDDTVTVALSVTTQGNETGTVAMEYTVTLSGVNHTGSAITFDFEDLGTGTATSGSDYTAISASAQVSVADGTNVGTISIPVTDDALLEADTETLIAQISNPSKSSVTITTATATGTIIDDETATAALSVTTQGNETGSVAIVYTLTLSEVNHTGGAITFDFEDLGPGTATSGSDYTAISASAQVSVADGTNVGTINIPVTDDALLEADTETLIVQISNPSKSSITITTATATGTITDDDTATAALSVTTQGNEDGSVAVVYTVTLYGINHTGGAITFDFEDLGTGTATSGSDYTAISASAQVSIAYGTNVGTISIPVTDDALLEADTETLIAQISNPSNGDVTITTATAIGTIIDDETATAALSVITQGNETGAVAVVYTVTLSEVNHTGGAITFDFEDLSTGTATSGSDYTTISASAQVSMADGTNVGTISIPVTDDALLEADTETLIAQISNPSKSSVTITTATATSTITDDDTATAALSVTTQGNETGSVAVVYTVTLSEVNHTGGAITFDFEDLGTGTATSGSDYTAISGSAQVSVADGTNVGTISIPVIDDALLEADTETLIIQISNPGKSSVTITTATATGTITDDDTATAALSVTTQGNEDGSVAVVYTVTLSEVNHTGGAITFDFDDLGTGTATSGSDYTAISASAQVSVADGTNVGTISIPVIDDALLEADTETLIGQISNPSNGDVAITTATATGTIIDDETATAALSVTTQGNETGSVAIVYTVTLSEVNHTSGAITFDFEDLGTSTATSGSDYTAIFGSAQVSVANGTNVGTISIPVTDDALLEADTETLTAQISSPSNGDVTITTATATGTIIDDETATAALSVTTQGNETGSVAIVYTVTLSEVNHTGGAITFDFEDLGTGTATSGSDYTAISASAQVNVADGTNVGTISIPVTDDALLEADTETLTAQISSPSNGDVSITNATATGTIIDDETATAALSVTTQGNETGTVAVVYTVTLSGVNHTGGAITFDFDDLGTGTATSGNDYTVISGSAQVSVADGTNVGTISIPVIDDALLEADTETLIVQISNPSNGDVSITTATATGTITDDETAIAALSVTTQGHETGSVAVVYTVTLSEVNHTGSAITFDFDDLGTGTATSGSDYTAISGSEQISVADGTNVGTISIPVTDDALLEADTETLIVQISNPSKSSVTITTATATGTITDDDTATAALSVTTQGHETGTVAVVYTVTLSGINHTGSAITFDFDDLGTGTATSGSDYTAISGSAQVNVADGTNVGTISIPVTDDTLLEADTETLIAQISNPSNGDVSITTATATGTIIDDETAIAALSVTTQGHETGSVAVVYTVTLSEVNHTGSAITFDFEDLGTGTATSGSDYTAISASEQISVTDGTNVGTISIPVTDDALLEADTETLIVQISNPSKSSVTITTATATGTITDDDTATAALSVTTQGHETGSVAVVYTVTLSEVNHTGGAITFDFQDLGTGTATSGSDYTAISGSAQVSIADGTNVGTISIPVTDDALLEADTETLIVQISNPSKSSVTITTATATGTITDDETATAALSVTTQGNETGSVAIVYTVTLSGVNHTGGAITFDFEDLSTGTATSGSDYTAISASAQVSVADGTNVGTISIPVTDDALLEADTETLIAQISTPSKSSVTITTATATGTIIDDDTATAALSVTTQGHETGSVAVVYTVTLSEVNHTSSAITFDFEDLGTGTATSGSDYTAISGSAQVSVADGTNVGTISIPVTDDALLEADTETLITQISSPSNGDVTITTATATSTITDDDTATAALSVTTQGNETGSVAVVYTVTLSEVNHTGGAITFDFEDLGIGTATSGSDYTAISASAQISVADGTNVGTISIPLIDDALLEADTETLIAQISTPSKSSVTITTATATGTITDDETATAALSVTTQGHETGTVAVVYTVTLSGVNHTGGAITFDFEDLGTGTAISGSDYTTISGSAQVSVADGTNVGTISIPVTDDALLEADTETLTAQISSPSNGDVTITTATATGTITDDDTATAALSVTTQGNETGSVAVVYTVTLSEVNHTGGAITFDFEDLGTGTATSGSDYTAISGSAQVSVADGTNVGTISIPVTDDALLEADTETLIAQISSLSNGDVTITTSTATGTITDDETATAALSVTTQGNEDGSAAVVYTVTLSEVNHTGGAITFDFEDLGIGTATSGSDYTVISASAQISVADGTNVGTISIPVTDDALLEADTETLIAQISNSSKSSVTITTATATGTITDDDTATAALSVTTQGNETGTVAVAYTVTLSGVNHTSSVITFDFEDLGTGTATSGSDYTAISASAQVSVADGTNVGTISIPVIDDALLEADTETLTAQISSPSNGDVSITTATATGTIIDDETATAALSVTTQGNETGSVAIVYTVTLSEVNHTGGVITFDFEDLGTGTATSGSDYTAISGSAQVSVADGTNVGTISIPVIDDALLEADTETLIAQISNPSNSDVSITTDIAAGTVTDNDTAEVLINDATITEGGDISFSVTLDNDVEGDVVVDISFGGGTASSADYTTTTQTLIFIGGVAGSQTVIVSTQDDFQIENPETFTASMAPGAGNINNKVVVTDTGLGMIHDNDIPGWVIVKIQDGTEEGNDVIYTVRLEDGSGNGLINSTGTPLTISTDFTGLTEAEQTDFSSIYPTSISILEEESSATIALAVFDDILIEGDELIRATIHNPITGSILTASADAAVTDDDDIVTIKISTTQNGDEDGTNVQYRIQLTDSVGTTLTNATGSDISASISFSGSAVQADIATALPDNVVISDGLSSIFIDLVVNDDALIEGNETLTAMLNFGVGGKVDTTPANVTVIDNDTAPDVMISNSNESVNEDEILTFSVTNSNAITIDDLDDDLQTVSINVTNGVLLLQDTSGLNITDKEIELIVVTGVTLTEINAALEGAAFNPNAEFNGSASIEITSEDPKGGTDTEIIHITVDYVNDVPIVAGEALSTNEDTLVSGTLSDTVIDIEGDSLIFAVVAGTEPDPATEGTLIMNPDGTYTFIPAENFYGIITFNYKVCDDGTPQMCAQEVVTITVNAINDAPIATPEIVTTNEDQQIGGDLSDNVIDIEGDDLSFTVVEATAPDPATQGTLSMNLGTFIFTPVMGFTGDVMFNYEVCDNGAPIECVQEIVAIAIIPNDRPMIMDTSVTVDSIDGISSTLADFVTDSNLDSLAFTLVDDVSNGTLTFTLEGTFDYVPEPGFEGNATFTFEVCDDGIPVKCEQAIFTITVLPMDTDEDGVTDAEEVGSDVEGGPANNDSDGDGIPDYLDVDDDGDGILTKDENYNGDDDPTDDDTDRDGIPDYLDTDDDGDGIDTPDEDANEDGDLTNDDCDNEGIPDYLDSDECGDFETTLVITANGDGINDGLVIEGIENFPNNSVTIYNRWGNVVWEIKGYRNDELQKNFTGASNTGFLSNNGGLPDGTYYYVINKEDGSPVQKGFLVIKK